MENDRGWNMDILGGSARHCRKSGAGIADWTARSQPKLPTGGCRQGIWPPIPLDWTARAIAGLQEGHWAPDAQAGLGEQAWRPPDAQQDRPTAVTVDAHDLRRPGRKPTDGYPCGHDNGQDAQPASHLRQCAQE